MHSLNDVVSQLLGKGEGDPLHSDADHDGLAKGQLLCEETRYKLHFLALFAQKCRHLMVTHYNTQIMGEVWQHRVDWSAGTLVSNSSLLRLSFLPSSLADCAKLA